MDLLNIIADLVNLLRLIRLKPSADFFGKVVNISKPFIKPTNMAIIYSC